jgi:hypothetical protein
MWLKSSISLMDTYLGINIKIGSIYALKRFFPEFFNLLSVLKVGGSDTLSEKMSGSTILIRIQSMNAEPAIER